MRITIDIETDNVAFDDHSENEVARIVRRIAARIERDGLDDKEDLSGSERDVNGNTVARFEVTK